MSEQPLRGVGVLVTRPREQADELVSAIEAAGGHALRFPAIEIEPLPKATIERAAANLAAPDLTVFVSRNAVACGIDFAGNAQRVAIGPATAAALSAAGQPAHIVPATGSDSESLLLEAALQDVANKVVRIVRGTDGRDLLGNTLAERGATVEYLATYERRTAVPTDADLETLQQSWDNGAINAVTVMSVATLDSLIALLPEGCQRHFARTPLVTPAARVIKETLRRIPGARTSLAAGTDSKSIVRAVARAASLAR